MGELNEAGPFAPEGMISVNGNCTFFEYEWRGAIEHFLRHIPLRRLLWPNDSWIAWKFVRLRYDDATKRYVADIAKGAEPTLSREDYAQLDPSLRKIGSCPQPEAVETLLDLFSTVTGNSPAWIEIAFPEAKNGAPAFLTFAAGQFLDPLRFAWVRTSTT